MKTVRIWQGVISAVLLVTPVAWAQNAGTTALSQPLFTTATQGAAAPAGPEILVREHIVTPGAASKAAAPVKNPVATTGIKPLEGISLLPAITPIKGFAPLGAIEPHQVLGSAPAAVPVQKQWTLRAGRMVQDELKAWAQSTSASGQPWAFEWKVDRGWVIPADAHFSGSFDKAAEAVVRALYAQGKPVRAEIWEGNRIFEVLHVDAR